MATPITQPPGLPVLGNVLDIDMRDIWGSFTRIAANYGELNQPLALRYRIWLMDVC